MKDFLEKEFKKDNFAEINIHEVMKLFLKNESEEIQLPFFSNNLIINLKNCTKEIESLKVDAIYDNNTGDSLIITNKKNEVFYIGNGIKDEILIICHDSGNNKLRFQIMLAVAKKDDEDKFRNKIVSKYLLTTLDYKNRLSISCSTDFEEKLIIQERKTDLENYSKDDKLLKEKLMLKDLNDIMVLPNNIINNDFFDLLNIKYDIDSSMSKPLLSFLMNESLESKDSKLINAINNFNKDKKLKNML